MDTREALEELANLLHRQAENNLNTTELLDRMIGVLDKHEARIAELERRAEAARATMRRDVNVEAMRVADDPEDLEAQRPAE